MPLYSAACGGCEAEARAASAGGGCEAEAGPGGAVAAAAWF